VRSNYTLVQFDAEGNNYTSQKQTLVHAFTRKSIAAKEDILSYYINRAIESLKLRVKTDNVVDMLPFLQNTLFDLTCKLTVDRDLGAINPHGKLHPSISTLNQAIRWICVLITARRLPRMLSYPLEICQGFMAQGVLQIYAVRSLVMERLKCRETSTDFGTDPPRAARIRDCCSNMDISILHGKAPGD
jgi:hypothetical protein